MGPIIYTLSSPSDLADKFANQLIEWAKNSSGKSFHLVLSGGKTPSILFSLLAEKYSTEVPWHKIHLWWGDERMVGPEDPESNFGEVKKLLFSKIKIQPHQIHRIHGESKIEEEIIRYQEEIEQLVPTANGWPTFDLIILGLGDDGHTASIFTNNLWLLESDQTTASANHPISGQLRITLTGKVLNNAKRVAFLATGESKSKIYSSIQHHDEVSQTYPASYIKPTGELYWFIDEACAGEVL
jgi:6-phosphogluconolactonase